MANPRIIMEHEALQPLADSIKTLRGSDGTITLSDMNSTMRAANTEVASQADIISQISDTLDDKSVGGASVGGSSAESQLTSNTEDLQLILARVNSMPQVGSSGSSNPVLQVKRVTPTEEAQSVTADAGYDGLSKVNVDAIPDNYADTSDATATAGNIEEGKTAYVNGEKVTGTIPIYNYDMIPTVSVAPLNGDIVAIGGFDEKTIIDKDQYVYLSTPGSEFGDATVADVVSGKTFTSANGVKLVGTNAGIGSGIDTSDATATANDMVKDTTAYVNGEKITGALDLYVGSADLGANNAATWNADKNGIEVVFEANERLVMEENFQVVQHVAGEKLGDATAADVAAGKTFTSANGLKITGTNASGGGLPTGLSAIATGTYTPTSDLTSNITVEHNLGVVPNFAMLMLCDDASSGTIKGCRYMQMQFYKYTIASSAEYYMRGMLTHFNTSGGLSSANLNDATTDYMPTETTLLFKGHSTGKLLAGYTYRWIVGLADGIV